MYACKYVCCCYCLKCSILFLRLSGTDHEAEISFIWFDHRFASPKACPASLSRPPRPRRRRRWRRWPRGASTGRASRTGPRWAPARPRSPPTASCSTGSSTAPRRPASLPTTTRPTTPPRPCPRPRPRRPTRTRRPGDTGSDSGTGPRRGRRREA